MKIGETYDPRKEFGKAVTEIAMENDAVVLLSVGLGAVTGDDAAADAVDDLPQLGQRGSYVVGGHEDSAQHQSAAEHLGGHPGNAVIALGEQERQNRHGANVSQRNPGGDDLAVQQVNKADDQ